MTLQIKTIRQECKTLSKQLFIGGSSQSVCQEECSSYMYVPTLTPLYMWHKVVRSYVVNPFHSMRVCLLLRCAFVCARWIWTFSCLFVYSVGCLWLLWIVAWLATVYELQKQPAIHLHMYIPLIEAHKLTFGVSVNSWDEESVVKTCQAVGNGEWYQHNFEHNRYLWAYGNILA